MTETVEAPFLSHMNDALAAGALVAAILAAFFSLWQGEIQSALELEASADPGNWEATATPLRHALYWRAMPLCVIASLTFVVLLARTVGILANAWRCRGGCAYDDVQALFLLTATLVLGLVVLTAVQIARLNRRLRTKR